MSPDAEAVLFHEIGQVLRGFAVYIDFAATQRSTAGYILYAVWDNRQSVPKAVSDPAPALEAQADKLRLQTEAILQLIKELAPDVRAAD